MNPPPHPSEPFPPPTLTRCARHRLDIFVQPGVSRQAQVLQIGARSYEMGRTIRGSIYGEVVHGLELELRPENNGIYSRTGKECAIKFSEKRKMQERKLAENPLGELSAMQQIVQHNLSTATLLEAAEDQYYIYSVMRFCPGGELWEWVMEGDDFEQFDEEFARSVFRQIIEQTCELHSLGWAHKDMSLENVMYDPESGKATIIDFGMTVRHHLFAPATAARPVNTFCPTMPGEPICGKRLYYPPEMQSPPPLPSLDFRRNDMWACGIMLFWLVTGSPPMEISTSADQRYNIIAVQGNLTGLLSSWGWSAHMSAEVVELIQSMLRTDPGQRPTAAQVLQHPWLQQDGAGAGAEMGSSQEQQPFPPDPPS